jgi:alanyl-tRNA synthetase
MDIADKFIEFFTQKEHTFYPSAPIVPDDATILFTNAGMVQFKDIFTGNIKPPANKKAVSRQICIRAGGKHNDLENVGYTARHHTMFEMLGNFSFGDYFKEDAISYAWEFITTILKLDKNKLWVTVHNKDDEAFNIWTKHIDQSRIKKFGDKDNFWQMGSTGACGPCSEIFYDQGSEFDSSDDYLGGDGDRFLEIWNLVFMQYERDKNGILNQLPNPSIDTGMGLERVEAILEGVDNNFKIKKFTTIIEKINSLEEKNSGPLSSYRVIADHIRTVSFMLDDGVLFDKDGRGYVLRRILRRAVRHGYLLGFKEPFLYKIVDTVASTCLWHKLNTNYIKEQIMLEEQRFFKTIERGMEIFNRELDRIKENSTNIIFDGKIAFKLYDTFGFPLDLTQDMLREWKITLDIDSFNVAMQEQKDRAKKSWRGSGDDKKDINLKVLIDKYGINRFVGYKQIQSSSKILALLDENLKLVDTLNSDEIGWIMLDDTPFYATSGGQNGDIGVLKNKAKIIETKKIFNINISKIKVISKIATGDTVDAIVTSRDEVSKHHSATHLLQSALRIVLGDSVSQAGSYNDDKKLRFDFTYPKALTESQITKICDIVNGMILQSIDNSTKELTLKEAKQNGAIAMFGEKYGDMVRVVEFKNISMELCGGTHVKNTSNIGSFYIVKESGVSSGVRRIEAVCGKSAIDFANSFMIENRLAKELLKSKDLLQTIEKLKQENRKFKKELQKQDKSDNDMKNFDVKIINKVHLIVSKLDKGDLKSIIDEAKNRYEKVAIMLFKIEGDRVLIVSGSKGCEIKSGSWVKKIAPILDGNGGGRDDFAQAGGKDLTSLDEAVNQALEYAKGIL